MLDRPETLYFFDQPLPRYFAYPDIKAIKFNDFANHEIDNYHLKQSVDVKPSTEKVNVPGNASCNRAGWNNQLASRVEQMESSIFQSQIEYFAWVQSSSKILTELDKLIHQKYAKKCKVPQFLKYKLDAIWTELIEGADYTPRNWQLPNIHKAYELWLQEHPSEVNNSGIRESKLKRVQPLANVPTGRLSPTPHPPLLLKQQSTINDLRIEESKIVELTKTMKNVQPTGSGMTSKSGSELNVSKTPMPNRSKLVDGKLTTNFSIQFVMSAPENLDRDWIQNNPLMEFIHNLEWVQSRLERAVQKNKISNDLERLQFPRHCEPAYISFNAIRYINTVPKSFDNILENQSAYSTFFRWFKHSIPFANDVSKIHLAIVVGFAHLHDMKPYLKMLQFEPKSPYCVRHGLMHFYRHCLMDHLYRDLSDPVILMSISKQSALQLLNVHWSRKNYAANTKGCLNQLVKILSDQSRKIVQLKEMEKMPQPALSWLAYSADGTLTVNYPCGAPAIVWTATPKNYKTATNQTTSNQDKTVMPLLKSTRSTKCSKIDADSNAINNQGTDVHQATVAWPNIKLTQQTGFYLLLFDQPTNRTLEHGENISSSLDHSTPTSTHIPTKHNLNSNSPKSFQTISTDSCDKMPIRRSEIGPLLAFLTPDGEGSIWHSNTESNLGRIPTNIKQIFTQHRLYSFDSCGNLNQITDWPPDKFEQFKFRKIAKSVETKLNDYVSIHCTSLNDLSVKFKISNQLELNITCFENRFKYQSTINKEVEGHLLKREKLLSKLPFMSSLSENYKSSNAHRKRAEENLQRIFKGVPAHNLDLKLLENHLEQTRKQISTLHENWLEYYRQCLELPRLRIPAIISSYRLPYHEKLISTRPVPNKNLKTMFDPCDENQTKNDKKLSKLKMENNVDNKNDDIILKENAPIANHLERGLPNTKTLVPTTNWSKKFPISCPIFLRLWLIEISTFYNLKKPHQTSASFDSWDMDNRSKLYEKSILDLKFEYLLTHPHTIPQRLVDKLFMLSSHGCRCNRQQPPVVTDVELNLFLNKIAYPLQPLVIGVYDSRQPHTLNAHSCTLLRQLYVNQQIGFYSRLTPAKMKFDTRPKSSRGESTIVALNNMSCNLFRIYGTGSCVSIATRLAAYRVLFYDLNQPDWEKLYGPTQAKLRKCHGQRPQPGDVLIYYQNKLCFVGCSLSGYPNDTLTKNKLEAKIAECTCAWFEKGFHLPGDYKLPTNNY